MEDIESKIYTISTQTNYNREEILKKIEEHDGDVISIVREYMGIRPKKKEETIKLKHLNQEIYRQMRYKLDATTREYREKNPINMNEVINNLRESEEREREKENKK